jgi:hypothetical protein
MKSKKRTIAKKCFGVNSFILNLAPKIIADIITAWSKFV